MEEHIPLPEELADDDSPYRRRHKAVAVRRSRFSSLARILRWMLLGSFVLLPVSYMGYRVAIFAATSSLFQLNSAEDVFVYGNHFVSREEIVSALGIPSAVRARHRSPRPAGVDGVPLLNIFKLSLDAERRQVESIAWVLSATLTRAYPRRLVVHVVERAPVAFLNVDGRVELVDGEGTVLEKPEKASFDFPILAGLDSAAGVASLAARKQRVALYCEFTKQLADELPRSGWLVSEVDLADADDLKALLVQGRETILVHFGHGDFEDRFRSFLTLLPEVRKTNSKIDSVDLRYRNQIVVNPQALQGDR